MAGLTFDLAGVLSLTTITTWILMASWCQWEEKIVDLRRKDGSLTVGDACFILQFIQEQTAPILSLRSHDFTGISKTIQATALSPAAVGTEGHSPRKQRKPETGSSLHKRHSAVYHKSPPQFTTAIKDDGGASLDLANLDDFPPVSLSMQEKR